MLKKKKNLINKILSLHKLEIFNKESIQSSLETCGYPRCSQTINVSVPPCGINYSKSSRRNLFRCHFSSDIVSIAHIHGVECYVNIRNLLKLSLEMNMNLLNPYSHPRNKTCREKAIRYVTSYLNYSFFLIASTISTAQIRTTS